MSINPNVIQEDSINLGELAEVEKYQRANKI